MSQTTLKIYICKNCCRPDPLVFCKNCYPHPTRLNHIRPDPAWSDPIRPDLRVDPIHVQLYSNSKHAILKIMHLTEKESMHAPWALRSLSPWLLESLALWDLGSLRPWFLEKLAPWNLGFLSPWLLESSSSVWVSALSFHWNGTVTWFVWPYISSGVGNVSPFNTFGYEHCIRYCGPWDSPPPPWCNVRHSERRTRVYYIIPLGPYRKIHVNGYISPHVPLKYGVPQGSVLGPLLFIMYTGELEQIINSHGLLSYCYDDDCQLSIVCNPGETESLASRVINCVDLMMCPSLCHLID